MKHHWIVIDTLIDCLENGIDHEKVKFATLQLDTELDRRLANKLPLNDIERLVSVLKYINYEITPNE